MSAATGDPILARTSRAAPAGPAMPAPAPSDAGVRARETTRRRRRPLGGVVMHAPQTLRALVRANELGLVILAAIVGAFAGIVVYLMTGAAQLAHVLLFSIDLDQHLSAMDEVDWRRSLLVPILGGLLMGMFTLGVTWLWPRRAVDPIEANALHGGRMSLRESIFVGLQTIISNGVGASIGLEAGYTQVGAGIASWIGRSFRLRRSDLRVLVGCGTAGAISAAFDAPLTGAFYGFELVIGTYTLGTFAPVAVASLVAISVLHLIGHSPFDLVVAIPMLVPENYPSILVLGAVCALVGIIVMRGVTLTEEMFRKSRLPASLRPMVGGVVVGALALVTPAVLSSGHGAIGMMIDARYSVAWVGLLVVLKATASAVSIGAGFRGGLFFASLFLGSLVGKFFGGLEALMMPTHAVPGVVCSLVGMSALAAAIIGAPLTMGFLALEASGSLPLTIAVLGAVVVSALTTRRIFGYSFATWRFHLRGEAIRSAVDVSWMRNLTVGRMMRREVRTVRSETPLAVFRRDFPLGSTQRVVVLDDHDRYAGIIWVAEAHADEAEGHKVADALHQERDMLLPQMTVKEAISAFERAESDALAVVDGIDTGHVIGLLTEQYALRRYSEELDRSRRELSGE